MTPREYLNQVLQQQSLSEKGDEINALRSERKEVEKLLRNYFKKSNPTIQYGGSRKKGTMIKESYDLDIICYFNHDDKLAGETLEDIYNNVKAALSSQYHVVPKTSTLRLESSNSQNLGTYFHIDVVPGRFIDDKKEDVFLYQSFGEKKWLKTNLQKHIDHIKNSELTDIIKLIKFWKVKQGLQIKTFVLELLAVEILKGSDQDKPDKCLEKFWTELRDNINNIKIEDPANPAGNDLSPLFDDGIKNSLSSAASQALDLVAEDHWKDIFGEIESMDDDSKIAAVQTIKSQNPDSPRPWCNFV